MKIFLTRIYEALKMVAPKKLEFKRTNLNVAEVNWDKPVWPAFVLLAEHPSDGWRLFNSLDITCGFSMIGRGL